MHARSVIAAALLLGIAEAAGAAIHGAWTASSHEEKPGFVQLTMSRRNSNWGRTEN